MRAIQFFMVVALSVTLSLMFFAPYSWAGDLEMGVDKPEFTGTPHLQKALAELAQAGDIGKGGACFEKDTMDQCAACCESLRDACLSLVISLCHQGDPNRAEFRHCMKGKEDRCRSDFGNCAWLCHRTE